MREIKNRPVFICGHPKSGTSLLRNLMDFHPQLAVYPEESRFFRNFVSRAQETPEPGHIELAIRHLIHIFQWNLKDPPAHQEGFEDRDYSWISYAEVQTAMIDRIEREGIRHLGDYLSAAVLAYREIVGPQDSEVSWWVEKTPYNEYYARQIFGWWPQARCIHVVRDPSDNYASYRRKHSDWKPEFFASNWQKSISAGWENLQEYGKDHYWILRYEDLVLEPETFLSQLLDFLEIDDHLALRTPTRAGLDWQGNSMFNQTFEGISASPVGRWKSELTRQEAAIIQQVAKKDAEILGYQVNAPKTAVDLFRVYWWQMRMTMYRIKQRFKTASGETERL